MSRQPVAASAASPSVARPHRVVVLGAGYAGTLAANRVLSSLSRREAPTVSVEVVTPRPFLTERIRLHQVAAGSLPAADHTLADVLHPAAGVTVGSARMIDPDARTVSVDIDGGSATIPYDTLVYAVGSGAVPTLPGVAEHALTLTDAAAADRARRTLADLPPGARVAVIGGGLTGIEVASEVAEARPELAVTVVSRGEILTGLSRRARRHAGATLARLGVTVRTGTAVMAVEPGRLQLADGETVPFDACVWAGGLSVPDLARRSGLAVDAAGRLRVDATLRSLDAPDIVGAGDAVRLPDDVGAHLRMSCAAAMPLGGHAADVALARIRGRALPDVSIGFGGQCVSLGRNDGLVQFVHRDDRPWGGAITGSAAVWTKERICRFTVRTVGDERRRPGRFIALAGPRVTAARPAVGLVGESRR